MEGAPLAKSETGRRPRGQQTSAKVVFMQIQSHALSAPPAALGFGRGGGDPLQPSSAYQTPCLSSSQTQETMSVSEVSDLAPHSSKTPDPEFDLDKFEVISSLPMEEEESQKPSENRLTKKAPITRPASASQSRRSHEPSKLKELIARNSSPIARDDLGLPRLPFDVILRGTELLTPYDNLRTFPLIDCVERGLKKREINEINQLQRVAWPHILRGRNCFIVGGGAQLQGKTLSYLVPIVAKALNEAVERKCSITGLTGPIGIILCSNKTSGEKIETHLESLLGNKMAVYRGRRADSSLRDNLEKQPDFLICRPDFILHARERYPDLLSFERLRYMIVDDCHVLQEEHQDSLREILNVLSHSIAKTRTIEAQSQSPVQFVLCGEEWNGMIKDACGEESPFNDPVLIISSLTQALVYGNVQLQLLLASDNEKMDKIAEIVQSLERKHFVVICQFRETAAQIGIYLSRSKRAESVKCAWFEEDEDFTTLELYTRLRQTWNDRSTVRSTVIVTTDDDLKELKLTGVTNIIHFESPKNGQDAFGDRHICMWNFFPELKNAKIELLRSYVLFSPCDTALVRVVKFLKTLNAIVAPDLQEMVDMETKNSMKNLRLCDGIKLYGQCNAKDKRKCERTCRHFFTTEELEAESTVPKFKDGRVDLKILKTIEPNQYDAQILNFFQVRNGCKVNNTSYLDELKKRNSELSEFYEVESNRQPLAFQVQGKLGAIKYTTDEETVFTRVRVGDVFSISENGNEISVRVFCVDIGVHQWLKSTEIYLLPPEFERMPPLIIKVIIAGMKPADNEEEYRTNWRTCRNSTIEIDGKIFTYAVSLSIGDTVWVKSLCEYEKIANGQWTKKLDLRKEFTENRRVAENNPDHLRTLYKLCEDVGFNCGIYGAIEDIDQEFQSFEDDFRWAFLRTSSPENPEVISVQSTYTVSPDEIYVVQTQFQDQLDSLSNDLNEEIESLIESRFPDYDKKFLTHYEEGLCVAAKDVENTWARAIITSMIGDPDDVILFTVFFVDHGDRGRYLTSRDLFPIPKKFVSLLPFQAIAVRLDHVEPLVVEAKEQTKLTQNLRAWQNEAKDLIMDDLVSSEGFASLVDVMAISKINEKSDADPICNYYNGFVMPAKAAREEAELGETLLSHNFARPKSDAWEEWVSTKCTLLKRLNEQMNSIFGLEGDSSDTEDEDLGMAHNSIGYEDEGSDEEGKEFTVNLGNDPDSIATITSMLNSMGLQVNTESYNSASAQPPIKASEETQHVNHEIQQQLLSHESVPVPKMNDQPNISSISLTPEPPHTPGAKVPTVHWSQTKSHLTLKVCLPDVKTYTVDVDVRGRLISFQSTNPANYEFSISLFAKVRLSPATTPLGQYLLIKLEKVSRGKWGNITMAKPPRWLRADVETINESDSESSEEIDDQSHSSKATLAGRQKYKLEKKLQTADAQEEIFDSDDDDEYKSCSSDDEILFD